MRRTILALVLALCMVVSGCAGLGGNDAGRPSAGASGDSPDGMGGSGADGGDAGGPDSAEAGGGGGDGDGGGGEGDGVAPPPSELDRQNRAVVREGTIALNVSNLSTARANIRRTVRAHGGFVADSRLQRHGDGNRTWRTGELVVRIPADNFSAVRAAVEAEGTVEEIDVRTRDVTDQLVDLNARIENLERQRDRLRRFMERANDTDDLVTIEQRLSEVQGEIERLQAQRRSLRDRVARSTLTVRLAEPRPEPETEESELPSPGDAFLNSVEDVLTAGQWLLVTTVGLVPWVVAIGVPVGVAAVLVRWRRPLG